jgi:hypothetical protein
MLKEVTRASLPGVNVGDIFYAQSQVVQPDVGGYVVGLVLRKDTPESVVNLVQLGLLFAVRAEHQQFVPSTVTGKFDLAPWWINSKNSKLICDVERDLEKRVVAVRLPVVDNNEVAREFAERVERQYPQLRYE